MLPGRQGGPFHHHVLVKPEKGARGERPTGRHSLLDQRMGRALCFTDARKGCANPTPRRQTCASSSPTVPNVESKTGKGVMRLCHNSTEQAYGNAETTTDTLMHTPPDSHLTRAEMPSCQDCKGLWVTRPGALGRERPVVDARSPMASADEGTSHWGILCCLAFRKLHTLLDYK